MKKLICAIMVAAAGAAAAGVSFSYQGALKMADGAPIPEDERNKTIEFRLYEGPTDTGALWGCQTIVHLDEDGLFNVELSDTTGTLLADAKTNKLDWVLASYLGDSKSLYIGLYVSGSTGEIRPRQKLLNVPAAAFAADVAQAKNAFTVDGIATFNGAVDAKSSMEVSGLLTAKGGLKVEGGALTVPSGGLAVKGGGLAVTGGLSVSGGNNIVPIGIIAMWSGAADEVPDGWALCDGGTYEGRETPDLRGRFIVGVNSASAGRGRNDKLSEYGPRATGGEEKHTLNVDEMPSHTHSLWWLTNYTNILGVDQWEFIRILYSSKEVEKERLQEYAGQRMHKKEIDPTGGNAPHENRPPYYALCFIMRVK